MTIDFSGRWFNQHASTMDIQVDPRGRVTGTYRTKVGAPKPSAEFPLVGFVSGDLIAFTVNFDGHGTLTAWAGQHTENERGESEIRTLWHLARDIPDADEPKKLWAGLWSGCDIFRRAEPSTAESERVRTMPSHPLG